MNKLLFRDPNAVIEEPLTDPVRTDNGSGETQAQVPLKSLSVGFTLKLLHPTHSA